MATTRTQSALPLEVTDFLLGIHRGAEDVGALHAAGYAYDEFLEFDLDRLSAEEIDLLRTNTAICYEQKRDGGAWYLPGGSRVMASVRQRRARFAARGSQLSAEDWRARPSRGTRDAPLHFV